jgi:Tol biopolymer transport system component
MDIWVRHINQPEPTRLTAHPSDEGMPRFSPDGSRVVLRSERQGGGIFVINALGGGLRRIADRGLFPRFSADGEQVLFVEDPDWAPTGLRRMYKVDANGGRPEALVPGWGVWAPPNSAGPVLSPDGRLVLFPGAPLDNPKKRDWWVAPIDGGAPMSSGALTNLPGEDGVRFPSLWLPGHLLFVAGTTIEGINLYSTRISDEGKISGLAKPLTAGPGMTWLPTASADGRIALDRFQFIVHLWEVELDGTTGRAVGLPRRITDDASPKFSFSVTRDGDLLAYSRYSGSPGNRRAEIRLQHRASGEESTAISLPAQTTSLHPRLSDDGSLLTWRNRSEQGWTSWVGPTEDPIGRPLCENCSVIGFFSDGTEALVEMDRRMSRIRIADGRETPIMELEGRVILDADLSWDDRWLAILTGEPDGTVAISVESLGQTPNPTDDWIEIAGRESWVGAPRWSPDGSILYYLSDRDDFICVWGQILDPETKAPVGDAFPVAHAHISAMRMLPLQKMIWTLAIGGDRLVFNASEATGDVYTAQLEPR